MIKQLFSRANNQCELCKSTEDLQSHLVSPKQTENLDSTILICQKCESQISGEVEKDGNHWRCLNDSIWSEVDAVKVASYRLLSEMKNLDWTGDLMDMMYMDEEILAWAQSGLDDGNAVVHRDSNGVILEAGDSVVLVKDLNVKGANFTAKRGTAVRRISLVSDNPEHIEGKINDQRIVILTQYVKKSK